MKKLVVNADDFGFTRDVNAGIVEAHRNGILTATTLMATGDAFDECLQQCRLKGNGAGQAALHALREAEVSSMRLAAGGVRGHGLIEDGRDRPRFRD